MDEVKSILSSKNFKNIQYDEFWGFEGKLKLPEPKKVGQVESVTTDYGLEKSNRLYETIRWRENIDYYKFRALKINGEWCWVYYKANSKGNIEKIVCLHVGGEKPAVDKTPSIKSDEKRLLSALPGLEYLLKN